MKIEIKNLNKEIAGTRILDNISVTLNGGRIYGLSGINGSGKTMLMRALCGLIRPSSGEIRIDGKVLGKDISFPTSVGALIEGPSFIPKYTGFKNLKILAAIQDKIKDQDIRNALIQVGLDPDDKRVYRKYSLGMKQRLGIACAIMEKPDLIILDEPFNALDETGVELVHVLLKRLKENGALIVLAAHDKTELELLSDEIFIISEGRIENVIVNRDKVDSKLQSKK